MEAGVTLLCSLTSKKNAITGTTNWQICIWGVWTHQAKSAQHESAKFAESRRVLGMLNSTPDGKIWGKNRSQNSNWIYDHDPCNTGECEITLQYTTHSKAYRYSILHTVPGTWYTRLFLRILVCTRHCMQCTPRTHRLQIGLSTSFFLTARCDGRFAAKRKSLDKAARQIYEKISLICTRYFENHIYLGRKRCYADTRVSTASRGGSTPSKQATCTFFN